MKNLYFLSLLFLLQSSTPAFAATPCNTPSTACEIDFQVSGLKLQLYSSYSLDTPNATISDAIVLIHGIGRNFSESFSELNSLVPQGLLAQNTLLLAPHFPDDKDNLGDDYLYWDHDGWPAGDNSLDPTATSSYTVLDHLITAVAASGNFPNLKRIVIAGMSAGGQTTQRYAAGNDVEKSFPQIHFRYVVVSPSSYMYLNAKRWLQGSQYQFSVPQNPGCDYNHYRYGLENLNPYMSSKSADQLVADYLSRDINYAIGEEDDATEKPTTPIPHDPKDAADLDITCPAEWQGASRLQRSMIFNAYLNSEFPQNRHLWTSVPGVAHQEIIFNSPQVSKFILGN